MKNYKYILDFALINYYENHHIDKLNRKQSLIIMKKHIFTDPVSQMEETDLLIVENSLHFTFNRTAISEFAVKLSALPDEETLKSDAHYLDPDDFEKTLCFLFAMESVNFGGSFGPDLVKEGSLPKDGGVYYSFSKRLTEFFENSGGFIAQSMALITLEQTEEIFSLKNKGKISTKLASMFTESLNDTGMRCVHEHNSSFTDFLNASAGNVNDFVARISTLPRFYDACKYTLPDGEIIVVPIFKRAQHLAGSIHVACQKCGKKQPFYNIANITAFPDNRIGHVMVTEGIITPSEAIKYKLENGIAVESGSAEEIEYRVLARHAIREMSKKTGKMQLELDHKIWEMSHGKALLKDTHYDDHEFLRISKPSYGY